MSSKKPIIKNPLENRVDKSNKLELNKLPNTKKLKRFVIRKPKNIAKPPILTKGIEWIFLLWG